MKSTPLLIKICGITRQCDLTRVEELGCDLAGFIFAAKSPRCIEPERAAALHSRNLVRVGVFTNTPVQEIARIATASRLDRVQLHGDYSPEDCASLGKERVIKVFWPEAYQTPAHCAEAMERYATVAGMFLFDAGTKGGGSGQAFNWHALQGLAPPVPWLLAGGIAPANAAAALAACATPATSANVSNSATSVNVSNSAGRAAEITGKHTAENLASARNTGHASPVACAGTIPPAPPGIYNFAGLDCNSGVETAPGIKDHQLLAELASICR